MSKFLERSVNIDGLELAFHFEVMPEEAQYDVAVDLSPLVKAQGITVITPSISRKDGGAFYQRGFRLKTRIPLVDIHGISIPGKANNPFLFGIPWHFDEQTSLHQSFPFLCFINREGKNKLTLGIKDPTVGYRLVGKLCKDERTFELTIGSLGAMRKAPQIFFSRKEIPWFNMTEVYSEWTGIDGQNIPSGAYDPVFCTWYAVHQNLNEKWVEDVATEAYKLGFRIFILDDGWFTPDTGRGYWYTGDWEVCTKKFPNFKQHVQRVQNLGMKYVLWIAPFMVGKKSRAYKNFKHLLVAPSDSFASLCPQSSTTREYLLEIIPRLYEDYNLDGFKFDFIDSLPTEPCQKGGHEHFCDSPGEGVRQILESLVERLNSLGNKCPLIEFRQEYANPNMRQYCTAFRAIDAPLDFDNNRRRIINLRSFSGKFPVYSDPIFWGEGELLKNIARHFINCTFSVPMLSVDLLRLNNEEKKIIKFWIEFYRRHRDILLFGKFVPVFAVGDFVAALATQGEKGILALYSHGAIRLGQELSGNLPRELHILNGSCSEVVDLTCERLTGDWQIEVMDRCGHIVKTLKKTLNGGLSIPVEIGGLVRLLAE